MGVDDVRPGAGVVGGLLGPFRHRSQRQPGRNGRGLQRDADVTVGRAQLGRTGLLAHVEGAAPADVLIIGSGNVGGSAAKTAPALGARVTVLTRSKHSHARYEEQAPSGVRVLVNSRAVLLECLRDAALMIGSG